MLATTFASVFRETNLPFDAVQCVLGAVAAILIFYWFKTRKNVPPGPVGLPLVGYLPFLGPDPSRKFTELSKKYGNIFSVRLGKNLVVILNDYEALKLVYSNPNSLNRAPVFGFLKYFGISESSGEEWFHERRLSLQILKELSIGSSRWESYIQEEVERLAAEIRSYEGKPLALEDVLAKFLANSILSLLIGRRLDEDSGECSLAITYTKVALTEGDTPSFTTQIPFLMDLLQFLQISDLKRKSQIVDRFLRLLQAEINKRKEGSEFRDLKDFINLYIENMQQMNEAGKKHYSSETSLLGNLNGFFLGSVDTVLSTSLWLFRLMAQYPDIQQNIQSELDQLLAQGERASFAKRKKMPYTVAAVMEAMRYSSIVPMSASRSAVSDFQVNGYTIPKGAQISANLKAMHFDPRYWKDPEKFKPERFLRDGGRTCETNPESFVPFSFGRRSCPGEKIAWMELLNIFPYLIQRFSVSLPEGESPDFDVVKGLVEKLKPQKLIFISKR